MGAERKAAVKQEELIIKLRALADESGMQGKLSGLEAKLLRLDKELVSTRQQVLTARVRETAQHSPASFDSQLGFATTCLLPCLGAPAQGAQVPMRPAQMVAAIG
jgi:hypothetical protein